MDSSSRFFFLPPQWGPDLYGDRRRTDVARLEEPLPPCGRDRPPRASRHPFSPPTPRGSAPAQRGFRRPLPPAPSAGSSTEIAHAVVHRPAPPQPAREPRVSLAAVTAAAAQPRSGSRRRASGAAESRQRSEARASTEEDLPPSPPRSSAARRRATPGRRSRSIPRAPSRP